MNAIFHNFKYATTINKHKDQQIILIGIKISLECQEMKFMLLKTKISVEDCNTNASMLSGTRAVGDADYTHGEDDVHIPWLYHFSQDSSEAQLGIQF